MAYTDFKNRWLGKRTNIDGAYGYQCVDLIKQYLKENYAINAGSWGNAKDYWLKTNPAILAKFNKTQTPKQGDIVVFKGISGNPYGHIGIVDSIKPTMVSTLEQNGSTGSGNGLGGNAIRLRDITKSRVYGYLTPKVVAPIDALAGRSIHLPPDTTAWKIYKVGSPNGSAPIGSLNPLKYGGLVYTILRKDVGRDRVVIRTAMFGEVSLPIANAIIR